MSISNFGAAGVKPGVCTSTTRPTTPYTGQLIFETDTGYLRVWDGAAWDYLSQSQNDTVALGPLAGLSKVIPTGVTSAGGTAATLSSDGTVNVGSGNTSIRIDGAFSATYDNYRLTYTDGVGSTPLNLNMQFGVGSTLTATNYNGGRAFINVGGGTWQLSADNNATSFPCGGAGTAYAQISLDILQPNFVGPTLAYGMFSRIDNGQVGQCWTHNNNSTAFTSVSIATSTGTISGGQIRIYGYRN